MICKDKYESERFVLSHKGEATLMGGYLRDLILDRPWKDIDLFYCVARGAVKAYASGAVFLLYWWDSAGEMIATRWKTVSRPEYESDFCVMECAALPGVQLILCSRHYNPRDTQYAMALAYMNYEFPCSLSQLAMALDIPPKERWVHFSAAFEWSLRDGAMEFSAGCPQEYRDRMASYFPHFSVKPDSPYF